MSRSRSQRRFIADALVERVIDWPDDALNELFQLMGEIETKYDLVFKLDDETRAAVEEGLAQVERGEFATDEEIEGDIWQVSRAWIKAPVEIVELTLTLRPYTAADEDAAVALWLRIWQVAYPDIDFDARVAWWRTRWRNELVPKAAIVVAEADGAMIGFVTIEPATGYLDQIVVAPEAWGGGTAAALLTEAKRLAPGRIDLVVNTDNARAIRFYRKHGFTVTGADVSSLSGRPLHRMSWQRPG